MPDRSSAWGLKVADIRPLRHSADIISRPSIHQGLFPMRFMHLMRSRLFGAAPQPASPLAAQVAALDAASPERIAAAALGDGEEALRAAAASKLPDGEILRQLAGLREGAASPGSSTLERIAQERLAQLIDAGSVDFAALCAAARNTSAALSVAGLCSDPARLSQALTSIEDPQQIARLVIEGAT